jgi:imidazoleglycerol-phosphate dehydratase
MTTESASAMRTASLQRHTNETKIDVTVNLDGTGIYDVKTGIGFLDHMLEQLARHSLCDLTVRCDGDLHIDDHHSTEDVGIAIGMAMKQALGDKTGILRYGACLLPMDETLSRAVIDFSGRPFLVWRTEFPTAKIGTFDTELVREWFQGFASASGATLHMETFYGVNSHHIAESCFKGLARAIRQAVETDPRRADAIPSTKGTLGGGSVL